MLHIIFKYKDKYTGDKWSEQECVCESVKECRDFYGLNRSGEVEYQFIKIEEVK